VHDASDARAFGGVEQNLRIGERLRKGEVRRLVEPYYPSLSAIARAITGTAWSGPRFFALQGASRAQPRLHVCRPHGWKFLTIGPDNKLYFNVGAPCNICMPSPG
jgi:hypothetical protein